MSISGSRRYRVDFKETSLGIFDILRSGSVIISDVPRDKIPSILSHWQLSDFKSGTRNRYHVPVSKLISVAFGLAYNKYKAK